MKTTFVNYLKQHTESYRIGRKEGGLLAGWSEINNNKQNKKEKILTLKSQANKVSIFHYLFFHQQPFFIFSHFLSTVLCGIILCFLTLFFFLYL